MDYKSIRTLLDAPRDKLEDLALRIACEYPKEFRHCAILNGMINDVEVIVTWDNQRVEATSKQMNDIRDYVAAGQKVEAIKTLRSATGIGLKDALETIKQLFPELEAAREAARKEADKRRAEQRLRDFVPAFAPVRPASTPDLTYFDRRPTDPGFCHPDLSGNAEADDFDNWQPPVLPDGFDDDKPRGVSLGELLQQQIDRNVVNEKITEAMDEIEKAFIR